MPNWWRAANAILRKDLRTESRSRAASGSVVLFAVVSVVAVSYAVGGFALLPEVQASMLWVVLFFASMAGLSRALVSEADRGTQAALRLVAAGSDVFLGKLAFNLVVLGVLDVVVMILFQILLPVASADWGMLVVGLALGSVGLAAASTLIAAVVAQTGARGALFTVLAFPVLLPVLIAGIGVTRRAFSGESWSGAGTEIQLLVSYAGIMITLGILLFDFVWRD